MSEHFDPAAGCRCGSCLELRGYVEQAEVWQARATWAEHAVAELRRALDPLTSAGARLPDAEPDDEEGFVRVTVRQVRAAYRLHLATGGQGPPPEDWQARATRAEARVAELEGVLRRLWAAVAAYGRIGFEGGELLEAMSAARVALPPGSDAHA